MFVVVVVRLFVCLFVYCGDGVTDFVVINSTGALALTHLTLNFLKQQAANKQTARNNSRTYTTIM